MAEKIKKTGHKGINRNILECKGKSGFIYHVRKFVLIETYWNVKSIVLCSFLKLEFRINRNILECKVKSTPFL